MLLVLDFNQRNAFNPILAINNNEINNIGRKNENTSFFISFFCYFLITIKNFFFITSQK